MEKNRPTTQELKKELERVNQKKDQQSLIKKLCVGLVCIAAVTVLISYLFMPVFRVYGHSMEPTLHSNQVVVSVKKSEYKKQDVIVFYYNNSILVKRIIAGPGDWIKMDQKGNVYVNDKKLKEKYVQNKSIGKCTVTFTYQVPENRYFVLGDNRKVSKDSRNRYIGCVSKKQIVGKIILNVWPLRIIE